MTILALFVAYVTMSLWVVWFENKQPLFMPFAVFKSICSVGKKALLDDLSHEMDGLNKMQFNHLGYRKWFAEVKSRGEVTHLEFFAFNRQRLNEIDAELERRGLK